MDPIDSLSKLLEVLRRHRASVPDRIKHSGSKSRKDHTTTLQQSSTLDLDQLERKISDRLRGIAPNDSRRRAARIFLETVLTWEFGDELIQDPRFDELVQEVESQMRSDPDLSAKLDKMLEQMMKG